MSQLISTEAKQRIRSPLDLEFMGDRFRTNNDLYTFTSPALWTIEKNLYYLLKNSVEVDLEPKYVRKPYLLSFDQYGTVTLEYLIMYVNNVFCSEEFNISTVILPTMSAIIDICADKFSRKEDTTKLSSVEW